MSDSTRGVGSGPLFSQVYQQHKPSALFLDDRGEHVRAFGDVVYVRSGWNSLTTSESFDERQQRLQAGATHVREAIDREYFPGLGDVIFYGLSGSAGHK